MSQSKTFHLPDLGEGLPDATIVEWFVKVGDSIGLDEPLVSMETAKAVVEVPSPVSGKVLQLAGDAGAVIVTGAMLAVFEPDPARPQRAEGHDTGHSHGGGGGHAAAAAAVVQPVAATPAATSASSDAGGERDDAGTVVGAMQSSNAVHNEQAVSVGGVKAMPAVRALAKKLGVDLVRVRASGADGTVSLADVKNAAASPRLIPFRWTDKGLQRWAETASRALKPPTVKRPRASTPPATTASAKPACNSRPAEARALAPDEHAVEMVCAGPRTPRCCAKNSATLPIS